MPWWRAVSASSASASACCWAIVGVSYETRAASGRRLHQHDVVAELFEATDMVAADALGIAAVEVVGAEVVVRHPAFEHVPEGHDHRMLYADNGFFGATSPFEPVVERPVVAFLRADGCPGDLLQGRAQPRRALTGGGRLPLPGALMVAGAQSRPRGEVRRRGERGHVH